MPEKYTLKKQILVIYDHFFDLVLKVTGSYLYFYILIQLVYIGTYIKIHHVLPRC